MEKQITRRQYLGATIIATTLAGCSGIGDGPSETIEEPTPTESLVVSPENTTTVTPTETPTPTTTPAATPTPTSTPDDSEEEPSTETPTPTTTPDDTDETTETETPEAPSSGGGGGGSGSGGGSSDPSTPTPTPTPAPSEDLVIEAGAEQSKSEIGWYERIEWYDTGRLVIEEGYGIGLKEAET